MLEYKQHSLFRKIDVDGVLSASYKLYIKNFKMLFAYSFIALLFVQAISYYLGFNEVFQNIKPENVSAELNGLGGKITLLAIVTLSVYAILNAFFINILYKNDIDSNITHKVLLSETLQKYFLHMVFFLVVATLMFVVGMIAGVIVFVIGMLVAALYLGTVLIPGGAILVIEEKNAFETIKRSFQLAHKDFWQALGAFVLYVIIMILLSLVITAIISIPFVIMFFTNMSDTTSFWESLNIQNFEIGSWMIVVNALIGAVTYPITAIFSLVMYFKLKYKEEESNVDIIQ
ncbi:MAG: hypothetical protein U9R54_04670 [Bacteroidota bacterium]|nr:hypothetical protein [Bacteroidota bacterium]